METSMDTIQLTRDEVLTLAMCINRLDAEGAALSAPVRLLLEKLDQWLDETDE